MTNRSRDGGAPGLTRRRVLRALGAGLAVPLVGCGSDGPAARRDGGGDAAADAETVDGGGSRWASGGTSAMTDTESYPNPFDGGAGPCVLTAPATLGPCHFTTPERRDVSEGYPGVPVRLALRVVDTGCTPLEGARVEIWHTSHRGLYSGGPSPTCTFGDEDAIAHLFHRGGQVSDADGQVAFDTCFPGWYRGRAIHIHFQVFTAGATMATSVSQLFFAPDLITEIFAEHVDYASFGQPDTPNDADGIYTGVGEPGIAEHAIMSDGAMLAWKQIVLAT